MRLPYLGFVVVLVAVAALSVPSAWAQQAKPVKAKPVAKAITPKATKYGALAVDRNQGFVYAWAYDQSTRQAANGFVLEECRKRNGECSVVVEFSGEGCASFHTIGERDGTAYGWGTAPTQAGAETRSLQTCNDFAEGKAVCGNHTWACNSADAVPFKVLREDPVKPIPAKTDCLVQFEIDEETNGSDDWVNRYRSPVYRLSAGDCPSAPANRYHSYMWDARVPGGKASEYKPADKDPKRLQRGTSMARDFYAWISQKPAPGGNTHFRKHADVYVTAVKEDLQSDMVSGVGQSDSDRQHGICLDHKPRGVVPVKTLGSERCRSWLR